MPKHLPLCYNSLQILIYFLCAIFNLQIDCMQTWQEPKNGIYANVKLFNKGFVSFAKTS